MLFLSKTHHLIKKERTTYVDIKAPQSQQTGLALRANLSRCRPSSLWRRGKQR